LNTLNARFNFEIDIIVEDITQSWFHL